MKKELAEESKEQPLLGHPTTEPAKDTKEEAKVVEPDTELLNQLALMGFSVELSKKGLIKVANESVAAAVDAIMELQAVENQQNSQGKPIATKTTAKETIIEYTCTMCTFINGAGKAICEVCGTPAPQTAIIFVKSDEDIKREQEEEDRLIREAQEKIDKEEKDKQEKLD